MSNDLEALARRAVACPAWRWMPRMVDTEGRTVLAAYESGRVLEWAETSECQRGGVFRQDESPLWRAMDAWADALPDLADPATLGRLLALVREAWGDPKMHAEPEQYTTEWRIWRRVWPMGMAGAGPTEAAALVAALEAAPAKVAS